ncbi:phosphotransferase [Solirubrobacter sp. CPCC 204708]|uniref:Phosphotransferase n=1 Tax=Solirubrobacter deserti TaxID=2282478 RepID=A0ABT4RIP2_9ACTN|nr:phosphotransferase [Solirubrobacter deserti]MBE2320793.1 phosphotransferase [Solirubrobacter deserti]MDA0138428.1 phosphotransferase [Solirubrobacter deserti]
MRPGPSTASGWSSRDRAAIRRLLGDVEIVPLGAGLDHRAYAVGDRLVARFGDGVEQEARLLAQIAPQLPLPVPEPVIVGAGCIVQRRIPGRPLLERPRADRVAFAPQLLEFAAAVHALEGVDAPLDDTPPEAWLDDRAGVAVPAPATRLTFIHGDLGAEHVFADGDRITGIIDWGDAAIGDPAIDLGRLMRDFGTPGDERARFYAICTALEDLDYGVPLYVENARAALAALH